MNFLVDIAPLTYGSIIFLLIVYGVGFTLGSFGGLFSECSGIINIALDGAMLIGLRSLNGHLQRNRCFLRNFVL